MNIKEIIKNIFPWLRPLHIKFVKEKENLVLNYWNKKYRKYLRKLQSENDIDEKIDAIKTHIHNGNEKYYIISLAQPNVGIYGYIVNIIAHLAYALSREWVPVIDMQNYKSIYQEHNENAWELFFEQPFKIGLEGIKTRKVKYCPNTLWYKWEPNGLMANADISFWGGGILKTH